MLGRSGCDYGLSSSSGSADGSMTAGTPFMPMTVAAYHRQVEQTRSRVGARFIGPSQAPVGVMVPSASAVDDAVA